MNNMYLRFTCKLKLVIYNWSDSPMRVVKFIYLILQSKLSKSEIFNYFNKKIQIRKIDFWKSCNFIHSSFTMEDTMKIKLFYGIINGVLQHLN